MEILLAYIGLTFIFVTPAVAVGIIFKDEFKYKEDNYEQKINDNK